MMNLLSAHEKLLQQRIASALIAKSPHLYHVLSGLGNKEVRSIFEELDRDGYNAVLDQCVKFERVYVIKIIFS